MNSDAKLDAIAPEYHADFAVRDRHYFTVSENQIESISSAMEGRVIHGAKEYERLNPALPAAHPARWPSNHFASYYLDCLSPAARAAGPIARA